MEKHIKALGIIFVVFGLLGVIVGLSLFSELGSGSSNYSDPSGLSQLIGGIAGFFAFLLFIFVIIIIIFTIALLIAGYGLINTRRWSRIFGIIILIISLFLFPIGTVIGIYGLWVLTKKESKDIFKRKSLKKDLIQNPEQEITDHEKEILKQLPNKEEVGSLNKTEVIDMKIHKHYKILGYLFIVLGLIGLLNYLYFIFIDDIGMSSEFYTFYYDIFLLEFASGLIILAKLIVGYGLIKFKTWSRIFGIIISVISLIGFPIGTAIGIYGLWVLTRKESKAFLSSSPVNVMEGKKTSTGRNTLTVILTIIGVILGIPAGFFIGYQLGIAEGYTGGESIGAVMYALFGIPIGMIIFGLFGLLIGKSIKETRKDIKDGYDMESFDKGEDLYESENYQEAFKYFIEVAQQGYPNAQNYLGYMYLNGQGVDQDNSKALEWYEKAATLGHALSQYSLGYMFHQGIAVEPDLVRAKFWYQKAADQGNTEAIEILKDLQ